jgi:hypothetical protein
MSEYLYPYDDSSFANLIPDTPMSSVDDSYLDAEMNKLYRQAAIGSGALGNIGGAGVPDSSGLAGLFSAALGGAKTLGTSLLTTPRGIATLLAMIYGARNTRPDSGGINLNLSPSKVTRTIVPGKYGPVAKTSFAADGGLMQAYAAGGMVTGTPQRPLPMEDGGFVMTKKAVDGAGGPQGLAQMLPGAKMIHGPGDGSGRDDRVHARIGNTTPARVSSGEAYVPKAVVDEAGGAKTLYAMMNRLQRSA